MIVFVLFYEVYYSFGHVIDVYESYANAQIAAGNYMRGSGSWRRITSFDDLDNWTTGVDELSIQKHETKP